MSDPYLAYEIFFHKVKNKKIDYSKYYSTTIYSRSDSGAEKQFRKTHPNCSLDIVAAKLQLTYNDIYQLIHRMSKEQKKQEVTLIDNNTNKQVDIDFPFYLDGTKQIAFEVYIDDY